MERQQHMNNQFTTTCVFSVLYMLLQQIAQFCPLTRTILQYRNTKYSRNFRWYLYSQEINSSCNTEFARYVLLCKVNFTKCSVELWLQVISQLINPLVILTMATWNNENHYSIRQLILLTGCRCQTKVMEHTWKKAVLRHTITIKRSPCCKLLKAI